MNNELQVQDHDWEKMWSLNVSKRELIARFRQRSVDRDLPVFDRFVNAWIAFNAYGSIACGFENDKQTIDALGIDNKLNGVFSDVYKNNQTFSRNVSEFQSMWPVYSESDAYRALKRRFKPNGPDDKFYPDEALMRAACKPGMVRSRPEDKSLSITWANILNAIYQVRCNLMHGAKSPVNPRDQDLVRLSYDIITSMMDAAEMF